MRITWEKRLSGFSNRTHWYSATIRGTAKGSAILSTFAIHRIKTAELMKSDFAPNNRLYRARKKPVI